MAFELVGVRLLMSLFGAGIQVWAVVIATSLAALAVGCWTGGKIADARPSAITLAVVLLLAAVSLVFVRVSGRNIPAVFQDMPLVAGGCCSAISILAAPLILLGMVQPVLVRLLIRTVAKTGTVVGGLMAAGTIGGIFGTAVTGLILIPHLGLSKTLLVLVVGTLAVAVAALSVTRRWLITATAIVIGVPSIMAGWTFEAPAQALGAMRVLEDLEGLYGHLEVLEYRRTRALACNSVFQTIIPFSGLGITKGTLIRGRDYIELIPYFRPQARTGLLIGVGAGLHGRALALYGIEVHGVEIDPAVIRLAADYFDLGIEASIMDGRAFLVRDQRRYDAVIIDTFLGGTPPEHLYTKEAFELVNEHLNQDGVIVVRLIGHPEHPAIQAVARTLQDVFPYIAAVRSGIANELQGVFLFASRTTLELGAVERLELGMHGFTGEELCDINTQGAALLTDNRSGLTLLSSDLVAEHRRNSLKLRREPLW
jgi:predicted membrane-bound spermidine synthase